MNIKKEKTVTERKVEKYISEKYKVVVQKVNGKLDGIYIYTTFPSTTRLFSIINMNDSALLEKFEELADLLKEVLMDLK